MWRNVKITVDVNVHFEFALNTFFGEVLSKMGRKVVFRFMINVVHR